MNFFIEMRKIIILFICFSLGTPQISKPLTKGQKSCLAGGLIALLVGIYCFKKNHERYHQDDEEYSKGKNVAKSSALGISFGTAAGAIVYALLSKGQSHKRSSDTIPNLSSLDMSQPTPGFENLGNSCFMNTALQCELNSPVVRQALRKKCSGLVKANEATVLFTQSLHKALSTSGVFSPSDIHTFIRNSYFNQDNFGAQQDSAEFLRLFIQELYLINKLYTWSEREEVKCSQQQCSYASSRPEVNTCLNLELQDEQSNNLLHLINSYYAGSVSEDDWKCDRCKKQGIALKKTTPLSTPKRLLIQLKRFRFDYESNSLHKNSAPVTFPMEAKLLDNKTAYYLQSFHVHAGSTLNSGHYYAYVKHPSNNTWYLYNDSIRTEVSNDAIQAILATGAEPLGGTPYVLCYEQAKV